MNRTIQLAVACVAVLVATAGQVQAVLIVGNTYQDASNVNWEYIGDYDVGSGPPWTGVPAPPNYSAIQAAEIVFGPLAVGSAYAISTSDVLVDHRAWYDGYGDGTYLPTTNSHGSGLTRAEDFLVDLGTPGYTQAGDYSAYIGNDRAFSGGGAINHVFVRASNQVPEPTSLAIFGIAALGLVAGGIRRKKQQV